MNVTWILVCDASRARVFQAKGKLSPWTLIHEFDHPQSRMKGAELMADKPGRVQQNMGSGNRPAMEPATQPKQVEAEHFAKQLADVLEEGFGHNAYARLMLVAPPQFLGLLRHSVSAQVSKRITASVDKDYSTVHERDLPERLADFL